MKLDSKKFFIIFVLIFILIGAYSCNRLAKKSDTFFFESSINRKLSKVKSDGVYKNELLGAKKQIGVVVKYSTDYYIGGFPPDDSGACADIISRTFRDANIDFKTIFDKHVADKKYLYSKEALTDTNINFRRVRNLRIFFEDTTKNLTKEVIPNSFDNLKEWQGGDIITYAKMDGGLWHIGIVSDKRNTQGIPYLIHNFGSGVKEQGLIIDWPTKITGHYRIIKKFTNI